MHSEHLGWILTCPSNLGTGLRAGPWSRSLTSQPAKTSRPSLAAWVSKLVEPLESTLLQLAVLGISQTLIVLENPKLSLSIFSSRVSLRSSDGNRLLRLDRTLTPKLTPLSSLRTSLSRFPSLPSAT